MDDNKENFKKNQPFETVVEENQSAVPESSGNLVPEEVAPEVSSPEESVTQSDEGNNLPPETPLVFEENKNRYLFIGVFVVIIFIVFVFILKFLFSGKKTPKAVSLTYWGLWEEKEVFEPLIADYQKRNPYVKINYQKMPPPGLSG